MCVITISRQIGSSGSEIGKKVAQKLGYHLVDKKTLEKIFIDYGFVNFAEIYETKQGFWERHDNMHLELSDFLQRVIMAVAHQGNVVILGRGSFSVLQGFDDVLNVRIKAPFEERINTLIADAADAIESGVDEEKGFVKTVEIKIDSILSEEVIKALA